MKKLLIVLCSAFFLVLANAANADLFLSSEVKALIVKAESGDVDAQFRVASAYDSGKGAPRNGGEAMKWYLMAAERGHAEAQNSVGSGLQAEKRYEEALPWYEKASTQGHALATNNLAYLYDLGLGVKQDRRKGFELYSRAADLGWAEAMWNIANMYGAGQFGQPDLVAACTWIVRAQRFADPNHQTLQANFRRVMPKLERILSADQLGTCKKDGESWTPPARKVTNDAQPSAATDRPHAGGG